jgi:hypothetical protein
MEFAIVIHISLVMTAVFPLVLIHAVEMENVSLESVSAMTILKEKIALRIFAIAIIEENVYLIKSVSVMKDSMVNIVKKVYVKTTVILMEHAIKENVCVKKDGEEKLVI